MSTATDLLKNLNGNTYNASTNPYGLDGVGGMDANLVAGFNAMGTAGDEVATAAAAAVPAAATATNAATTATQQAAIATAAANTAASLVLVKQPSEIAGIDPVIDFVFSASTAVPSGVITGSSGKWVTGPNGLLTSVAAGTCPIDFDPVTGTTRGLLVEESRTNLLLRSNEFENAAWSKFNGSVTATNIPDPQGGVSARAFTSSGDGTFGQTVSTSAVAHTGSIWLKVPSGTLTINLYLLQAATVLVQKAVTLTTAWQRVQITGTTGSTSITFQVGGALTIPSGQVIHMYGGQQEVGSVATSYIPTVGSTVTRAADVNTLLLSSVPGWNANEGTIYMEAVASSLSASYPMYASLNDGTGGNSISIYKSGSGSNNLICDAMAGGVSQSYLGPGSVSAGVLFKAAFSFKAAAFAASLNGAAAVTGSTGALPTVTRLDIGSRAGFLFANSPIRRIVLFPRALSNAILPLMTA